MSIVYHPLRLDPGADLRKSIQQYADKHSLKAAWIVTCMGSLTKYAIRFANQSTITGAEGHFEILSVTGLVSVNGSHLHITVADEFGKCIGGHLSDGSIIFTTAEIIITSTDDYNFKREFDAATGYKELKIEEHKK